MNSSDIFSDLLKKSQLFVVRDSGDVDCMSNLSYKFITEIPSSTDRKVLLADGYFVNFID